jgi:hypothetical protein
LLLLVKPKKKKEEEEKALLPICMKEANSKKEELEYNQELQPEIHGKEKIYSVWYRWFVITNYFSFFFSKKF